MRGQTRACARSGAFRGSRAPRSSTVPPSTFASMLFGGVHRWLLISSRTRRGISASATGPAGALGSSSARASCVGRLARARVVVRSAARALIHLVSEPEQEGRRRSTPFLRPRSCFSSLSVSVDAYCSRAPKPAFPFDRLCAGYEAQLFDCCESFARSPWPGSHACSRPPATQRAQSGESIARTLAS